MATLTGELISETYDSLLKVTDNNTITGVKKRITDGFGNEIPLQLSSTDIEIDGTLILSALTDLEAATKFLSLKADNSVAYRTAAEVLSDIGGASAGDLSGYVTLATAQTITGVKTFTKDISVNGLTVGRGGGDVNTNTAFGLSALRDNTSGVDNTAISNQSLLLNTTGSNNVGVGTRSLKSNTTGSNNSAFGLNALETNSTGNNNTSIGLGSLNFNTTGSNNVAVGHDAGKLISGGGTNLISNNSIFIGQDSRPSSSNQTNQIVIGDSATGNGSNTVTIGNSSIINNYFSGNVRGGAFIKSGGTSSQFLKADGSIDSNTYLTSSSLTNYVTLDSSQTITGAKSFTALLTGTRGSFASSGSDDTFAINHSSGSGIGLNITKAGNGEGLYINKTSGTGNAATIIGTLNATALVKSGGTSSQFLKADGTVDSTAYGTGSVTSIGLSSSTSGVIISLSPVTTSGTINLSILTASGSQQGLLSSTDWTTFNSKQAPITLTTTGTSGPATFSSNTLNIPNYTVLSLAAIGISPNANGASIVGSLLNLQPASASFGGVVTTGAQTFAGDKTLTGALTGTSATFSSTAFTNLTVNGTNSNGWGNNIAFKSEGTDFGYVGSVGSLLGNTTKDMTIWATSGNGIRFYTNGNNLRATIDTSGNLGLGVTPSAWDTVTGFQVGRASIYGYAANDGGFQINTYYGNSSFRYIANGTAEQIRFEDGAIKFRQAPSGTAGNAISFTQAMTLDASGNLGIGTTSPSFKLDVNGTGRFSSTITSTNGGLLLQGSAANSSVVGLITEGTWPWRKLIDTETSQNSYGEYIDGNVFYAKRIDFADRNSAISGVGTNIYTLNLSTGAATFSSSVATTGVIFPATQVASADPNTLDDYEEGTFTPVLSFAGGTTGITYSEQSGKYTKIGRSVTVEIEIALSNKGSSSGRVEIGNLPFSGIASIFTAAIELRNVTFTQKYAIAEVGRAAGSFFRVIFIDSAGNSVECGDSNTANNSVFFFSATYFV
jgi:hypothetical protein